MTRLHFVLSLALIWIVPFSMASTIHVPADQPTIQAGINAAKNGDKVLVAPGTYVENINFMGKAITVTSSGGPKVTTIDGNATNPVAVFVSGEGPKSVLSRFTLQNGYGTFAYEFVGGGICIINASPTIKDNIIINNNGNDDGGGIGVISGSANIAGNIISNNTAQYGGGLYVSASTAQIIGNTISNNTAGIGGGIELNGALASVIQNNKILGNSADTTAGGIDLENEAEEVIVQNLIAGNLANGASQFDSLVPYGSVGFVFVNNTVVSAPNGNAFAAIIADGYNTGTLFENNIIYAVGDQAALICNPYYQDGPPIVEYNDAYNQTLAYGDSCSGFSGTNGNISGDPEFKNVAKGHYQLKSTSPAINVGSNYAPDLPVKDLAGHPRIVDTTIDMGAYEYQAK